jgi:uncharacterized protein (TIGR02118 family)
MHVPHGSGPIVAASLDISRRSVIVGAACTSIAAAFAAAGWSVTVQAQEATPAGNAPPMEELNAVVVFYKLPDDPVSFRDQLTNHYVPMVNEIPDIQEFIVQRGIISREGTPAEFYQVGTFMWESQAAMEAALATEAAQAAVAETANLATGGFSAYFAHVEFLLGSSATATPAS